MNNQERRDYGASLASKRVDLTQKTTSLELEKLKLEFQYDSTKDDKLQKKIGEVQEQIKNVEKEGKELMDRISEFTDTCPKYKIKYTVSHKVNREPVVETVEETVPFLTDCKVEDNGQFNPTVEDFGYLYQEVKDHIFYKYNYSLGDVIGPISIQK